MSRESISPKHDVSKKNLIEYISRELAGQYDPEVLSCMPTSSLLILTGEIQPIENPEPINSTSPTQLDGNRYTRHNNTRTHL